MRDLVDLENNAYKFWPTELAEQEKNSSIIPKLIETQDKFISLLNISDASPIAWKETLNSTSSLSANLFLKHLVVLSDIGQARHATSRNSGTPVTLIRSPTQRMGYALNALRP